MNATQHEEIDAESEAVGSDAVEAFGVEGAAEGAVDGSAVGSAVRGVSAFLLTPLRAMEPGPDSPLGMAAEIDEPALIGLVERAVAAGVDSIAVLGSTGSYMYLTAAQRERVVQIAVRHAVGTPVLVGVGAIATSEVLAHVQAAEKAGAAGIIVAPVSYQRLNDEEVFGLFLDVAACATVPIIVYDNPTTTGFTFSLDLYERVAALPGIASIKVPPPPAGLAAATAQISAIRERLPVHVTIGVSGDASAALGLAAGCDAWYSVIAGVLPRAAMQLADEAREGAAAAALDAADAAAPDPDRADAARAPGAIAALRPLLSLFAEYGSLRVAVAVAEELGLVTEGSLPRPLLGLDAVGRSRVNDGLRFSGIAMGLEAADPRERLEAAMSAGTDPAPAFVPLLTSRMGTEADFQVREMLTWAIVRHSDRMAVDLAWGAELDLVPLLLEGLKSESTVARAQSLHTLTKLNAHNISGRELGRHVTVDLLHDADDEVARTAWRAAVQLWPDEAGVNLAGELVGELGRGDLEMKRSLARALVGLGDAGVEAVRGGLRDSRAGAQVRAHAEAVLRLAEDPESTFWIEAP